MIKVALLGAPSSDKTGTALTVQAGLTDHKVQVCDDYVSEIAERSDNTLGHFASYLGNLQVAIGRWERERQLIRDHKPDVLITCGTVVETTVYEALNALAQASLNGESLTLREVQNNKRASVTMTMLGIMTFDTWDYDYAYYMPLDEDATTYNKAVDTHILEACDALDVQVKKVGQDAVAVIVQDILAHEQTETPASD